MKSTHEGNPLCFGDREVFQCTVTGPGVLLWVIESLKTFAADGIIFNVADEPGVVPDNYPEVFKATLISVARISNNQLLGNLTSQIIVLVTPNTLGKRVYCSDGQHKEEESPSIAICRCKYYNNFVVMVKKNLCY